MTIGREGGPQFLSIRERLKAAEGQPLHGITAPIFALELIRLSRLSDLLRREGLIGLYDDLSAWEGKRHGDIDPRSEREIRLYAGSDLDNAAMLADGMIATNLEAETDFGHLLPAYEYVTRQEEASVIGAVTQVFREVTGYTPPQPPNGLTMM